MAKNNFTLEIKVTPTNATDTVKKRVLIEPAHAYTLPGETTARPGFFNGDFKDWSDKLDLSQESEMQLFSDYESEVIFQYKNDTSDGGFKKSWIETAMFRVPQNTYCRTGSKKVKSHSRIVFFPVVFISK